MGSPELVDLSKVSDISNAHSRKMEKAARKHAKKNRKAVRSAERTAQPEGGITRVKSDVVEGGTMKVVTPKAQDKLNPTYEEQNRDLRLRVNTLEINYSLVLKELAVLKGQATPYNGTTVPSNVSSMRAAVRKANEDMTEPSSSVVPTSIPGNEAEDMYSPAAVVEGEVLLLPAPSKGRIIPFKPKVLDPIAEMALISDENHEDIAKLAAQYGMTLADASTILFREYSKWEKNCYNQHGTDLTTIRIKRQLLHEDWSLDRDAYVRPDRCSSKFAAWSKKVDTWMPDLAERSKLTAKVDHSIAVCRPTIRCEAEQVARQRAFNLRKDVVRSNITAIRGAKLRPKTYTRLEGIHNALHTDGPGVTTDSQLKAIVSFGHHLADGARRFFGMKSILRSAKRREEYHAEYLKSQGIIIPLKCELNAPDDETEHVKNRKAVRRYSQAGIGH